MNWLDKNQEKILIFTWTLIILTSLFVIFTSPVKAASSVHHFPYDYSWNYTALSESQIEVILNQASHYIDTSSDNLIIFFYEPSSFVLYPQIVVAVVDSVTLPNNTDYDNMDLVTQSLSFHFSSSTISMYSQDLLSVIDPGNQAYSPSGYSFFGSNATYLEVPFSPYGIYRNMVLYGTVELDNKLYIGTPENSPDVITGHATEPINDPNNIITDSNNNPIARPNRPTPNPFVITSPQFPSIDTSTLETLVESLIDIVKYGFNWIGDTLSGLFSNLLSNIGAWVDFIVQSFSYGFNNVVKAIQNLASDFYNNMVSLFEPLYDFFNGIATFFNNLVSLGMVDGVFSLNTFLSNLLIPDSDTLAETLSDADVHGTIPFIKSVKTAFNTISNQLTNLTPTKVFILPSFTWHGTTYNLVMDFSWYDDYKVYGDTVISGFLILFYIHWVYINISNNLRGAHSIGHDLSKGGD